MCCVYLFLKSSVLRSIISQDFNGDTSNFNFNWCLQYTIGELDAGLVFDRGINGSQLAKIKSLCL